MANELQVTAQLTFTKSPAASVSVGQSTVRQFNVTGAKYAHGVQNIGLAAEAIDIGDIGTAGWYYIKNLDPTNFVTLLTAAAGAVFAKLKPGEVMIGRFGCAAPAAQADTAPLNIEYLVVED